jgi:hypothetical protein
MSTAAGWYADPYGRHDKRYWDGSSWTRHVFTGGVQSIEPLEPAGSATSDTFTERSEVVSGGPPPAVEAIATPTTTTVAPIGATPAPTATPTPTPASASAAQVQQSLATAGAQVVTFLDRLGPQARARGPVDLRSALAGVAGALWAAGALLVGLDDMESTGPLVLIAAILIGAAVVASLKAPDVAGLRSALVGAVSVAVPVFALALTDEATSKGELASASIIAAVIFMALWIARGLRGRPLLFGLGVYSLVTFIGSLGAQGAEWCEDSSYYYDDCDTAEVLREALQQQGWLFVIAGSVLLGGTRWADKNGYLGIGTGLVASALVTITSGGVLIASAAQDEGEVTGPLVLLGLAGAAMAWVGSAGNRRATMWWGVVVCAIGLPAALLVAVDPEDSATGGILVIIAGAAFFGLPALVKSVTSGQQATPPSSP